MGEWSTEHSDASRHVSASSYSASTSDAVTLHTLVPLSERGFSSIWAYQVASICSDIYMGESRYVAHLVLIAEVSASSTPTSTTAQSFCSL